MRLSFLFPKFAGTKTLYAYETDDMLFLLALVACGGQRKSDKLFTRQIDTVWIGADGKEPVTVESLPGINAPVVMNGDTVYTNVDTPPVFSEGDLNDYLQEAVKDIHVGEAVPIVMFVVSKAGYPCRVALRRSAKAFIPDSLIAENRFYRLRDSPELASLYSRKPKRRTGQLQHGGGGKVQINSHRPSILLFHKVFYTAGLIFSK